MPEHALNDYLPVLMLLMFSLSFAGGSLLLSWLLGKKGRRGGMKDTAFECGMEPFTTARRRFPVKFYVVAMLFILFDIEVVFLYPWAIAYRSLGMFALVEMVLFLGVLTLGLVYVIRKGALDWARQPQPRSEAGAADGGSPS